MASKIESNKFYKLKAVLARLIRNINMKTTLKYADKTIFNDVSMPMKDSSVVIIIGLKIYILNCLAYITSELA